MKEPLTEHIYLESCKISFRSCISLSKLYLKNVHYRLTFFVPTEQFAPVDYSTTLDTICLRITVSESYRQNLNIEYEPVHLFYTQC